MVTSRDIALKPEHLDAIRVLAAQSHRPCGEVNEVYVEVLESLSSHAHITDYLTVLIRKKVRDKLR